MSRLALRRARQSPERPVRRGPGAGRERRQHLIFDFVVRKLKWLAAIHGAPQIFDAMLLSSTALFRPRCFRAISELESLMVAQPDISVSRHRLGGIGFRFRGREVSHVHGNGLLDCLVGRANRDLLLREQRADAHHIFPGSGWISFWLEERDDVDKAIALIRIACAHREYADEH